MKITREEASDLIEKFVSGDLDDYEWDDFTNGRIIDPDIAQARNECISIRDDYPPENGEEYCNEMGTNRLLQIASDLKNP